MIAKIERKESVPAWHAGFLAMLPTITKIASYKFRDRDPESKEDLTEEVIVNAMIAYKRLFDKGRVEDAHPSVLARYAIAQVCNGRKGGSKHSRCDAMSEFAQRMKEFRVERLDHFDNEEGAWQEVVVEDRHTTPADVACTRLDFCAWLCTLSKRQKQAATRLASGESTGAVAKLLKVSSSRISSLRRELMQNWYAFQGEDPLSRMLGDAAA